MIEQLQRFHKGLKALRTCVNQEIGPTIGKRSIRNEAQRLAKLWFEQLSPEIRDSRCIPQEKQDLLSKSFGALLKLSNPNNSQVRYLEELGSILKGFNDEVIIPIQTQPKLRPNPSALEKMLAGLPDASEDEYLKEAVACASGNLIRGAAVLGWCAAIDRIHRAIEKMGFNKFNTASQQMAAAQSGRFKRFNKSQNVGSISELREVFDSDILWILEGMQLIDSNQHTRLRSCFDLRCQSAHPGEAPVTEYNLLSFFSDIDQIVLRNPKFQI